MLSCLLRSSVLVLCREEQELPVVTAELAETPSVSCFPSSTMSLKTPELSLSSSLSWISSEEVGLATAVTVALVVMDLAVTKALMEVKLIKLKYKSDLFDISLNLTAYHGRKEIFA